MQCQLEMSTTFLLQKCDHFLQKKPSWPRLKKNGLHHFSCSHKCTTRWRVDLSISIGQKSRVFHTIIILFARPKCVTVGQKCRRRGGQKNRLGCMAGLAGRLYVITRLSTEEDPKKVEN